jgi:riboflavin kinase/FMN adenylyltransferase
MANGTVVTIGTFDGVHIGHQTILAAVGRQAQRHGALSIAYAFGLPPRLRAEDRPGRSLLLPESIKDRLLLSAVDRVLRASFPEIRHLSPAQFAGRILRQRLRAESVVVGPSFRFGALRAGDPTTLRSLGEDLGFSVTVVPPVLVDGELVNSTRVRSLLSEGDIARATLLLGRPPVLIGDVSPGDQIGRKLGYPTANLAVAPNVLLPNHGVYVARAFVRNLSGSTPHPALLYVGARPTLRTQGGGLRCEVHLLVPPDRDLHGARIEVHLLDRLRGDRTFASLEDLSRQIERDADRARESLARFPEAAAPLGG